MASKKKKEEKIEVLISMWLSDENASIIPKKNIPEAISSVELLKLLDTEIPEYVGGVKVKLYVKCMEIKMLKTVNIIFVTNKDKMIPIIGADDLNEVFKCLISEEDNQDDFYSRVDAYLTSESDNIEELISSVDWNTVNLERNDDVI